MEFGVSMKPEMDHPTTTYGHTPNWCSPNNRYETMLKPPTGAEPGQAPVSQRLFTHLDQLADHDDYVEVDVNNDYRTRQ